MSQTLMQPTINNFEILPSEDGGWVLVLDNFQSPQDAMAFSNNVQTALQWKADFERVEKEIESISQEST